MELHLREQVPARAGVGSEALRKRDEGHDCAVADGRYELDLAHRKLQAEAWKLFEKDAIGEGLEEYERQLEAKVMDLFKDLQV